jgi:glutathione synthase/RimK-type ligase-like ATP-grasp enzyme
MQPSAGINVAKNKLNTFKALQAAKVSIPEFTTDKATAENWVRAGTTVLARTKLNASEGRGIVICKELPLVDAPLYVKLIKKKKEFRVHVMNGQVIDLQEKRRRNGVRQPDGKLIDGTIRNIGHDWVFCRENIVEPAGLREIGIAAVRACGLMFGAVDVIWNEYHNRLYALEVNTAPGLCESTATSYARALLALPNFGWQTQTAQA